MKKIPTIFERDWNGDRSRVVDHPHADCGWVFDGDGIATQKLDGSCCLFSGGKLWKRRELKKGQSAPPNFVLADEDEETGKTVGWVPVGDGPEDRWHREAFSGHCSEGHTYELVGPKVQGGIETYPEHRLIDHRECLMFDIDKHQRTFAGLRDWLTGRNIEGLVFHHPDGRMGKIKLRDFGLKRGVS